MKANPKIFKAYDIRGEWDKDWDEEFVFSIGQAMVKHFKPTSVAIGYDMRKSSPIIFEQLCLAFTNLGVNVLDLGMCGTELTYFASSYEPGVDLALMITASHNPGKDNGIKVTLPGSISVGVDSGLDKVRDLALDPNFKPEVNSGKGKIEKRDLWQKYKAHVLNFTKTAPNLKHKIVVDCGNGMGSVMLDKLFPKWNMVKMFWQPDGSFPNHPADPFREENTKDLQNKVVQEKADLGIALDGDGDRIFVVDSQGRYVPGYYLAALLTNFMLENCENPKQETIVHDPRYYKATVDVIKKHGAKSRKVRVGHTLIKAAMRDSNSLFSAECSGHIFYRENNFAESSIATLLLVLKMIEQKGPLHSLLDPLFEKYPVSGEVNFTVENSQDIIQALHEKHQEAQIDLIDGLSVEHPSWRFNIRSSNTQPLLRLNIEAHSHDIIKEKFGQLKDQIGGNIADH